jgi:hypothetical protein
MIKQIEIHGASNSIVQMMGAPGQAVTIDPCLWAKEKMLRLELQKRFGLIRGTEDLDPNQFRGLETPKSLR